MNVPSYMVLPVLINNAFRVLCFGLWNGVFCVVADFLEQCLPQTSTVKNEDGISSEMSVITQNTTRRRESQSQNINFHSRANIKNTQ
jgi:hypothetical protein